MLQRLHLPEELDGNVWRYATSVAANRRHRHAELELNLVTGGRGTYLVGNLRYEIRRGDLVWLFPGHEHVLVDHSPDFAMWIGVFRRRAIRRFARKPELRPLLQTVYSGECCRRLSGRELDRCEALLLDVSQLNGSPLVNAGLGYVLLQAWDWFQRARGVPVRKLHPAVERAARIIGRSDGPMNLASLAREVALSPSRLSRLFKEQTGTTMVDFRNRQRIERFLQLYGEDKPMKALDAALDAGFGSYPQFHRVFRRVMGCSPAEYQRASAR